MAHYNTVFSQLLKLVPRHEFETLAIQHHEGRKLRKMTRWSQFMAMTLAQLSGRTNYAGVDRLRSPPVADIQNYKVLYRLVMKKRF